jgi:uncharacterized protein DUF3616
MRVLVYCLLGFSLFTQGAERLALVNPSQYSGMCDASAAIPVNSTLFIVANDEDNRLRMYRNDQPGPPLKEFDMNGFLQVQGKSLEADLEGAARIGDRAFWIGSHGRNRVGKERLNRCRFFATDIRSANGDVSIEPVGKPYRNLIEDLSRDARFQRFDFDRAADRAPKEFGALNIEGLSATPDGQLLIGFRNPIPDGKALIIPMLNPNEVIQGEPVKLGNPMLLDLEGLGIRDIALYQNTYIIIAGSYHSGGRFRLYEWSGATAAPRHIKVDHLNRYNPEAIIVYPDKGLREFQILSDDGERRVDGVPGKEIKDPARQMFRSFWLKQTE